MKFRDLQKDGLIEPYKVEFSEIKDILDSSMADVKTAKHLLSFDVCWAFNIAYNALLQAGIALMHSKGFRPVGEAKHVAVILFLRKLLGKTYEKKLDRFNMMRKKRHKAVYGILRNITEYEAKESVKFASTFVNEILTLVEQ